MKTFITILFTIGFIKASCYSYEPYCNNKTTGLNGAQIVTYEEHIYGTVKVCSLSCVGSGDKKCAWPRNSVYFGWSVCDPNPQCFVPQLNRNVDFMNLYDFIESLPDDQGGVVYLNHQLIVTTLRNEVVNNGKTSGKIMFGTTLGLIYSIVADPSGGYISNLQFVTGNHLYLMGG